MHGRRETTPFTQRQSHRDVALIGQSLLQSDTTSHGTTLAIPVRK